MSAVVHPEAGAQGPDDVSETDLTEALLAERDRASFLAGASRAMSGSLNLDRTTRRFLHLVVPELADAAYLALVGPRSTHWAALDDRRDTQRELVTGALRPGSLEGDVVAAGQAMRSGPGRVETLRLAQPGFAPAVAVTGVDVTADAHPLTARGTTFGVLVALRVGGSDVEEARHDILAELAERASFALDASRLYGERSHIAAVLQASLLPPRLPEVENVRLAARYRAAFDHSEIGGDFYDVHGSPGDWTVVVGDVCGKGVEAAVLTGQARTAVRAAALIDRRPAQVLSVLNGVLHAQSGDAGTFVTVACGRLRPDPDGSGAWLDLASAGHPPPLVLSADGSVQAVPVRGVVAGIIPDARWGETTLRLSPGDCCLFYTDGVTEARGDSGQLGEERLEALLARCVRAGPEVVVDVVEAAVNAHLRGRAHDDIALLAIGVPS